MKNQLVQAISNCPVTGYPREARLVAFQIGEDLNMKQLIRIVYLSDDRSRPRSEQLMADGSLSDAQKQTALTQFADRTVSKDTAGSWVDPATGEITTETSPGAVPERNFFQALSLGDLKAQGMLITDKTTLSDLIYQMLTLQTAKIDARNQF